MCCTLSVHIQCTDKYISEVFMKRKFIDWAASWVCRLLHERCVLLHGHACCFMGVHVASWACMLLHGRACCFMGVHVASWACMLLHGRAWYCSACGCSWFNLTLKFCSFAEIIRQTIQIFLTGFSKKLQVARSNMHFQLFLRF